MYKIPLSVEYISFECVELIYLENIELIYFENLHLYQQQDVNHPTINW